MSQLNAEHSGSQVREAPHPSLFRAALQSSGVYSIAMVLQRATALLLLPFTTRRLTTGDYGLAGMLEQVSVVLAILLSFQFAWAMGYFHFEAKTDRERREVAGTGVFGTALIGLAICLICWPLTPLISRMVFGSEMASGYIRFSLAIMPVGFAADALFNWLRVVDRQKLYTQANLVRTAFTVAGVLLFVWTLRMRVWGVQAGAAVSAIAPLIFLVGPFYRLARPVLSMKLFWRMMRFSTSIGVSSLAVFFIHFGDRFFLVHFRALSDVGIYDLSYKLGMLVSTVYSAFHSYWSAQVYQIVKRPDSRREVGRLFTYVTLGTAACGLGISMMARPALRIMAAPAFHGAADLAPLLITAYCIRALGDFWRCMFLAAGKPAYDAACNFIGAVVCLGGYIVLIPRYGVWGAAATTLLAFVVIGIISLPWALRLNPCHLETVRLLKVLAAASVSACLFHATDPTGLVTQILWAGLCLSAFPATLLALRFPTPEETRAALAAPGQAYRALLAYRAAHERL